MKGQSSIEYVSIVGIALLFAAPFIISAQSETADFLRNSETLRFSSSLDDIERTVERTSALGEPASSTVSLNTPSRGTDVRLSSAGNLGYSREGRGQNNFISTFSPEINLVDFPVAEGVYSLRVEAYQDRIWMYPDQWNGTVSDIKDNGVAHFNAVNARPVDNFKWENDIGSGSFGDTDYETDLVNGRPGVLVQQDTTAGISSFDDSRFTFSIVFDQVENGQDLVTLGNDDLNVTSNGGDIVVEADGDTISVDYEENRPNLLKIEVDGGDVTVSLENEDSSNQDSGDVSFNIDDDEIELKGSDDFVVSEILLVEESENDNLDYLTQKWINGY